MKGPKFSFHWRRGAVVVIAISGLLAAGLYAAGRYPFRAVAVAGADSTNSGCAVGEPLSKCDAPLPTPNPTPAGGWVTSISVPTSVPATRDCSSSFFNSTDQQTFTNQFGNYSCFLIEASNTWVVIGSGENSSAATAYQPTPGGSAIAVDRCSVSDAVCLDPSATHALSDFTIYYPPDTTSGDLAFETVLTPAEVEVSNAFCGVYMFNPDSGNWYVGNRSVQNYSGYTSQAPVLTPTPISGSMAATSVAPTPITGSCESTPNN